MGRAIVEIYELIKYVDSGTRPFEEGAKILNSQHILLCGSCNSSSPTEKYFALCLKSTSLSDYPHEINISINRTNNISNISAHCTCQAGNSGRCKHVVAVLLFLNRKSKEDIEELGCTDVRQQWGHIKQKVSDAYSAEPFHKFCHGTQCDTVFTKSEEVRKEIFKTLCEADVESELSQHVRCYRSSVQIGNNSMCMELPKRILKCLENHSSSVQESPAVCDLNALFAYKTNVEDPEFEKLLKLTENNIWSSFNNFNMTISNQEQAVFYNKNVSITTNQAKDILKATIKQNSPLWYKERKIRITGSVCYNLYTYMKKSHGPEEWNKKLNSIYNSNFKGNCHTMRGQEFEENAKLAYERVSGNKVQRIGLLILSSTPWLGYSADGIINAQILLEIKCPKNDNKLHADKLVFTLPYIEICNGKSKLKQRHAYYGQVQLGLCLLGLQKCNFIIYDTINDTCCVIEVDRNENFIVDLVTTLSICYFKYILPWLTAKDKNVKENE